VLDTDPALASKATRTGNPLRPAVLAAIAPYTPPEPNGPLRLLAFGGSQGARIIADVVPPAVERLEPALRARLSVVQQARSEDIERVGSTYARLGVTAEVAPFFLDLPARVSAAHLVVSRSGASTVAELAALGRPAVLVPLPHALDQDQLANARVLEAASGAILLRQEAFTPERLAREIAALGEHPARLAAMAAGARTAGAPDAAERLADLVMLVAGLAPRP
jgi:UDP-N-acetylglucosamine--N-acetylmuramyl-(pentapeptide) pyrophosphoryl-undecaprenol N-acetylglucosamine transferase